VISADALREKFDEIQCRAVRLAGGLEDLAQRAAVYHHVYKHSSGNHVFPLIAAHGALWARGYFRFGLQLGGWLSWPCALSTGRRIELVEQLRDFANAFRDINRRVCIDTYTSFHFTAQFGNASIASELVAPAQLEALNRMHHATRHGQLLSDLQKREIFETFFRNEQEKIVGPGIAAAVSAFDWPLVKSIALRPWIRFAYFPRRKSIWFGNFSSQEERVANGLRAFEFAAGVGWHCVEDALRNYAVLPEEFFANSERHFQTIYDAVVTA